MILVIGLDGLDPDLFERLRGEGRLPTLGRLAESGWHARLRSTFPPVSVPAWSTFLTGVGPGRHGLFDFTRLEIPHADGATQERRKRMERARVRFQTGADRAVPTVLELADAAGRRVCSLGIPTTYPVPRLARGAVLAGFDSPFTGRPDSRSVTPEPLFTMLRREGLDLRISTVPEGRKGPGWHSRAAKGILESIGRRLEQAMRLLREGPWDLFLVHFQAADTAGHHFLRYFDASSPRYDAAHPERARVLPDVYDALDDAVRRIVGSASEASDTIVLSDHGMGPASDRACYLNRWLEEQAVLALRDGLDWAGALRSLAIRRLPRWMQSALFRAARGGPAAHLESAARFSGIDFERSAAFSEESSTLPGIWILDSPRKESLIRSLRGWDAVRRVYRREDLYRGAARSTAPDLLLDLRHPLLRTPRGYRGPSVRRLEGRELDGERGAGLNGVHRPEGVLLVSGERFSGAGVLESPWIGDLAPTLLAALGVPIPSWMEGRPLACLVADAEIAHEPLPPSPPSEAAPLSRSEAARIEARLRALGYLG